MRSERRRHSHVSEPLERLAKLLAEIAVGQFLDEQIDGIRGSCEEQGHDRCDMKERP
jgi:hypothetical protein